VQADWEAAIPVRGIKNAFQFVSAPLRLHIASMPRTASSDLLNRSLLTITQTAAGCAVGLLIAGKIGRPAQKTTAATLLGVGALLALPAIIDVVANALIGPGSERGERRRLDSIRTDSGLPDDAEIF
jgi:hypothetical protein